MGYLRCWILLCEPRSDMTMQLYHQHRSTDDGWQVKPNYPGRSSHVRVVISLTQQERRY